MYYYKKLNSSVIVIVIKTVIIWFILLQNIRCTIIIIVDLAVRTMGSFVAGAKSLHVVPHVGLKFG